MWYGIMVLPICYSRIIFQLLFGTRFNEIFEKWGNHSSLSLLMTLFVLKIMILSCICKVNVPSILRHKGLMIHRYLYWDTKVWWYIDITKYNNLFFGFKVNLILETAKWWLSIIIKRRNLNYACSIQKWKYEVFCMLLF